MKKIVVVLLAFCVIQQIAGAADSSLEAALNQKYKKRVYALRHPLAAATLLFDSSGNPTTSAAEGSWTVYSRVQIKKIKIEPGTLRIEGERIGAEFGRKGMVALNLNERVRLEISLAQPLHSADEVQALFSHIFAFTKEDFLASTPKLWRDYLESHTDVYADDGNKIEISQARDVAPKRDPNRPEKDENGVYYVNPPFIKAPVARSAPDPPYTQVAKRRGLTGTAIFSTVVDKQGRARNIKLVRPIGLGLDEAAVTTIETWAFDPATRNGDPVNVAMMIEISFNLY